MYNWNRVYSTYVDNHFSVCFGTVRLFGLGGSAGFNLNPKNHLLYALKENNTTSLYCHCFDSFTQSLWLCYCGCCCFRSQSVQQLILYLNFPIYSTLFSSINHFPVFFLSINFLGFQLVFTKIPSAKHTRCYILFIRFSTLKSIALKHLRGDNLVLGFIPFRFVYSIFFFSSFPLVKLLSRGPKWCNKEIFRFINCTGSSLFTAWWKISNWLLNDRTNT